MLILLNPVRIGRTTIHGLKCLSQKIRYLPDEMAWQLFWLEQMVGAKISKLKTLQKS